MYKINEQLMVYDLILTIEIKYVILIFEIKNDPFYNNYLKK